MTHEQTCVVSIESHRRISTIEIEPDEYSLIKPGELVDVVELSPLTLQDRRIYNLLILNAWESITEPKEHRIHKRDLRGSHGVNDRVEDSLLRLMGAIAQVRIERNGGKGEGVEAFTRRLQLLGTTDESMRSGGVVYYTFPAGLRAIIRQSTQWARLQKQVMFAFSSKYALALYEMVQKRGNLKYKTSEEFSLDRFRALLGVERGKLTRFLHFRQRAIEPAVLEVNALGEYACKVEPIYAGRKVTGLRLSWWTKSLAEKMATLHELRFSRIGRRARLQGRAETVLALPPPLPPPTHPKLWPSDGQSGLTERAHAAFRRDFPDLDVDVVEREFQAYLTDREPPADYVKALYGFARKKANDMR
jgi:hypothetical protein